jgi:hypothetical protein
MGFLMAGDAFSTFAKEGGRIGSGTLGGGLGGLARCARFSLRRP